MNGRTNSSGTAMDKAMQIPLDPCTNLETSAGNAKVGLTWDDPVNKYATPEGETAGDPQQLAAIWQYTALVRKVGSAPNDINDGIIVTRSSIRDQYKDTPYEDNTVINDTEYYYGVFAVNQDDVASDGIFTEGIIPKVGTPLSELAEGTVIKINENGSPVEFYLVKHNYEPDLNGQGRELVLRKDIYDLRQWHNTYKYRGGWSNCDLNRWFNSTYKNLFSEIIKTWMGSTRYYISQDGYAPSTRIEYSSSIFTPSCTEYGVSRTYVLKNEGSNFPNVNLYYTSPLNQWTRSLETYTGGSVGQPSPWAKYNNEWNIQSPETDTIGSRPCFTVPNTVRVNNDLLILEEE